MTAARCPAPEYTPDDLILVTMLRRDDWTPTFSGDVFTLGAQWGRQTQNSHEWVTDGIGRLRLRISKNGLENTVAISTAPLSFADGSAHWLATYYTSDDGATRFFFSDDAVTWTQLGDAIAGTPGAPYHSPARVDVGVRNARSNPLTGDMSYYAIRNGHNGTVATDFATALAASELVAEIDLRSTWNGTDSRRNRWYLEAAQWVLTIGSISGLSARLTSMEQVDQFAATMFGFPHDAGGAVAVTHTSAAFHGGYAGYAATQNGYITYKMARPLQGGTWSLALTHHAGPTRGIYTIAASVDGTTWTDLGTVDGYAASVGAARNTLVGVAIPTGARYFRFRTAAHNGSASGYTIGLSGISGMRTGA